MFEKLNKYRIQERMSRAFMMAVGVPIAAAVLVLIFLIVVAIEASETAGALSFITMIFTVLLVLAIITAFTISMRLGKFMANDITEPLDRLKERLVAFSKGDITSPFPELQRNDEIAEIMRSSSEMAERMKAVLLDINYILGEMANCNYNIVLQDNSKYTGEFGQTLNSMRQMKETMVSALRDIGESSAQVSAGSGNLADSAQSLAEGATEQAGAVEELHATITTISDAAKSAAATAEEAYQQSQRYASLADKSSEDMKEMVEAMGRINETSQKIGNIISEIENIASQTNLLSLNASIEAARAGEAGRGFAVVADQIRQLAEQSSKSAVDTRTLIEGAMQEIDNGNKVADRAVASIETVVEGIGKLTDASQELSTVSANQAATLQEAEDGVNQISDVVQTNAAVAQQSSATSQQLSAQASVLDGLIAKFELP